jgi:FlaA1/EpsC-like NDP-sugar epimerase
MDTPRPSQPGAILIGTGRTVGLLLRQLDLAPDAARVLGCILADDPFTAPECRVLGTTRDLPAALAQARADVVLVSLPAGMIEEQSRISAALSRLGLPQRHIPPVDELLRTGVGVAEARAEEVDPVALLGRTPHGIDRAAVARILAGRRVLITGAGGSIGSELARIAASFSPEEIVLVERSENALFEIDRQIGRRFPAVRRRAVLHDVVDADGTLRHAVALRPEVIFHAAAHKHVPLMEDHPSHAVNNNLFGTKAVADAAVAVGAERFVLISTDKAVNPTSVMGATKRLAELYVMGLQAQSRAGGSATRFSMVRFGNVLGSACSVMPIWQAQLREGGPLTVTDPRMTRYFMTIHEAASLVIQAAAIDEPGDAAAVYVLDMGQPVRILDLAQRLVLAHHRRARVIYRDGSICDVGADDGRPPVEIHITGARPGEKLHEELAYRAELLRPTPCPGINAWAGPAPERLNVAAMVAELSAVRHSTDRHAVLAAIRRHVPEMALAGDHAAQTPRPAPPARPAYSATHAAPIASRDADAAA